MVKIHPTHKPKSKRHVFCLTDQDAEAQRGFLACPRLHSQMERPRTHFINIPDCLFHSQEHAWEPVSYIVWITSTRPPGSILSPFKYIFHAVALSVLTKCKLDISPLDPWIFPSHPREKKASYQIKTFQLYTELPRALFWWGKKMLVDQVDRLKK